jgi:hypothetical protein
MDGLGTKKMRTLHAILDSQKKPLHEESDDD